MTPDGQAAPVTPAPAGAVALPRNPARRAVLITGGAGFIGANLAHRLLSGGALVTILDNLARPGVERNLRWLRETHGDLVQITIGDVRDALLVRRLVARAGCVYHFAAQVAVTTSLTSPRPDFEVNAAGSVNVLEAARTLDDPPPVVYTSTNKVYGACERLALVANGTRYVPAEDGPGVTGVDESWPVDPCTPYGCSKAAADQYAQDYARSFGLPNVVFRMSCIYGPRQFGNADQGWVAHFLRSAIEGTPVTIFGDGRQVRDVLHVDDLVDALLLARAHARALAGQAFNIGGGPERALSLLELLDLLREIHGPLLPAPRFEPPRTGDQRYYVSDIRRFQAATGWRPRVGVREGITGVYRWLRETRERRPAPAAPGVRHGIARVG
jgi:CDP-paratose 2-epimerase